MLREKRVRDFCFVCDDSETWQRAAKRREKKQLEKKRAKKSTKKQKSKKKRVKKDKRETQEFFFKDTSASSSFFALLSLEKIHRFERRLIRTQRRLYEEDSLRRERV